MQICQENIRTVCEENEVWERLLALDHADILELGCGTAELTRQIACRGAGRLITAMEVDEIQHSRNMQIDDLPNVHFMPGAAEAIPCEDDLFDIVLMFKSLHHVPVAQMDQALEEIRRVLRAGGMAYISEPVFAGYFNEILRLFHDEEEVRKAAFLALRQAVDEARFILAEEVFFYSPMHFVNFTEFEQKVIDVTHSHHQLSDALRQQVKEMFDARQDAFGVNFEIAMRVDVLVKPI